MKKNVDGVIMDMTPEEEKEWEKPIPESKPQPTAQEKMQKQIDTLTLALADIYGGGTI